MTSEKATNGFYIKKPKAPVAAFRYTGNNSLPLCFISYKDAEKGWQEDAAGRIKVKCKSGGAMYLTAPCWVIEEKSDWNGSFRVLGDEEFCKKYTLVALVDTPNQRS